MSSIRRLIRGFYKLVHPDLLAGHPKEAIECNARSLQELNAYIDRLETCQLSASPFVARTLQFFKPVINRKGEALMGSLRLCSINLESIPPSVDIFEKEEISIRFIRGIEKLMKYEPMFSGESEQFRMIEPIISNMSSNISARSELAKIWEKEAFDESIHSAIFNAVDQRINDFREYKSILIHNKLMRNHLRIKNKKRRDRKISNIEEETNEKLKEIQIASSLEGLEPDLNERKIKIIEAGFHPDLVFFDPSLTDSEREQGIARVCGINLSEESELWLLENIWKVVRSDKTPPVPVVLGREYASDVSGGFVKIPFDFALNDLVDYLEETLENVRDARRHLLAVCVAVYILLVSFYSCNLISKPVI